MDPNYCFTQTPQSNNCLFCFLGSPPAFSPGTASNFEAAAAQRMSDEQNRTATGFTHRPPETQGQGTSSSHSERPTNTQPAPPAQGYASPGQERRHVTPTAHPHFAPDPAGYYDTPRARGLSDAAIVFIRHKFPNLSDFPDHIIKDMDFQTIHQLNVSIAAQADAKRKSEPEDRVSQNLEELKKKPTAIPAGIDDRNSQLHSSRFLGGPVCSNKLLWQRAREILGEKGVEPLANFDLGSVGLGGHVTTRGWIELHDPGSTNLTLKLFNIRNVSNTTRSLQHFTLADSDGIINTGESLSDITDLDAFKTAMRAAEVAQMFALPWNRSILAINGFLLGSDFGAKDLAGRSNRVSILTDFVNYIFKQNAANWRSGEDFLSNTDVALHWTHWFGTNAASKITLKEEKPQQQQQRRSSSQGSSRPDKHQKGHGKHDRGSSLGRRPPAEEPCRRYNAGVCPNNASSCATSAGTKLLHTCCEIVNGKLCGKDHPQIKH